MEHEFREPKLDESCYSGLICSSKREDRNRLVYMSGPAHVSFDLKKTWGLVGIHMEGVAELDGRLRYVYFFNI